MNDTLIKLASRLPKASSLDGHADHLYASLGKHFVAIIEFRVADRTEVDPDSDAAPKVKLEIGSFEVAYSGEDDAHVRTLQREIYQARTTDGTFDAVDPDNGEVSRQPTDDTVKRPLRDRGPAGPRKPRARKPANA